jgi:hypothetical protein
VRVRGLAGGSFVAGKSSGAGEGFVEKKPTCGCTNDLQKKHSSSIRAFVAGKSFVAGEGFVEKKPTCGFTNDL